MHVCIDVLDFLHHCICHANKNVINNPVHAFFTILSWSKLLTVRVVLEWITLFYPITRSTVPHCMFSKKKSIHFFPRLVSALMRSVERRSRCKGPSCNRMKNSASLLKHLCLLLLTGYEEWSLLAARRLQLLSLSNKTCQNICQLLTSFYFTYFLSEYFSSNSFSSCSSLMLLR